MFLVPISVFSLVLKLVKATTEHELKRTQSTLLLESKMNKGILQISLDLFDLGENHRFVSQ